MEKSLGEALIDEIERVRDLVTLYESFPTGVFAASMMRQDIITAEKAMLEQDLPKMINIYQELKTWKDQ